MADQTAERRAAAGSRAVVVGVDGSDAALSAVAWAAREAALHHTRLRIVHGFAWPLLNVPPVLWQVGPEGGLHAHATHVVEEAEKVARSVTPAVEIQTTIVTDLALSLLLEESRAATYVVVGASGQSALADAVAGSPTVELIGRSRCPVAVVRDVSSSRREKGLVVVGVDGSAASAAAVGVAAEEASLRKGRLMVVHVATQGRRTGLRELIERTPLARLRRAGAGPARSRTDLALVDKALTGLRGDYPDLPIEERVLTGHPAGALVELSDQAELVVVGTRGRGGFAGLLLGSVSQTLLHHAHCPVIVVPPRAADGPGHES